ncbi:MAG TPA: hypothetical protein VKJ01_04725, partial [Candidatus Solibacter sp.]|nr:hypothetical protein [Candidatus Solibacter sp.]
MTRKRLALGTFHPWIAWLGLAGCALPAGAQTTGRKDSFEALNQFSASVQALSARVAPSVAQISVTRFAPLEE